MLVCFTALLLLRYIVVTIVAGFQTVAIFMQTGEPEKSEATVNTVSDIVKDSHHKVCIHNLSLCYTLQ